MTKLIALMLSIIMLAGGAAVENRTADIQEISKELITLFSDEETRQNTDASIITVTEEPGKNDMTTMKISGHGKDFTNMSSFINYREDGSYLEANLSLMEPSGEFDLFWLDVTVDKTDDSVAVSGLMQAVVASIETNINYEGMMTDGCLTIEAVADIDGDELDAVSLTAQASDVGEITVTCESTLPEGEEYELVNQMLKLLPETLLTLIAE